MNMWRKELAIVLYLCCVLWGQSSGAESNCDRKEKSSLNLEIAENLIKKTLLIIPDCPETVTNKSPCGAKAKMTANLDMAKKLIAQTRLKYPICKDDELRDRITKGRDCSEVFQSGERASGVYTIRLDSSSLKNRTLDVFCDMEDDSGGWTVIQRRGNFIPPEIFSRNWNDYKNGFGSITKEFWIGNDNLFGLTNQANYSVKFDLEDKEGNKAYSLYDTFWIEDETAKYKLHIDGYSGPAGESMEHKNNMYFSTKDRNNSAEHCINYYHSQGGWWIRGCGYTNLNGADYMYWNEWRRTEGLAATEIKLKRNF